MSPSLHLHPFIVSRYSMISRNISSPRSRLFGNFRITWLVHLCTIRSYKHCDEALWAPVAAARIYVHLDVLGKHVKCDLHQAQGLERIRITVPIFQGYISESSERDEQPGQH